MTAMKQLGLGLNLSTKKTRKRWFFDEMKRVVPWAALVQVVQPCCSKAKTGRPPFGIETVLRVESTNCSSGWARSPLRPPETPQHLVRSCAYKH